MTKKELIKLLADYPDNINLGLCYREEPESYGDYTWSEIDGKYTQTFLGTVYNGQGKLDGKKWLIFNTSIAGLTLEGLKSEQLHKQEVKFLAFIGDTFKTGEFSVAINSYGSVFSPRIETTILGEKLNWSIRFNDGKLSYSNGSIGTHEFDSAEEMKQFFVKQRDKILQYKRTELEEELAKYGIKEI